MEYLGANESKVIRVIGDFNKIELPNGSVDFVVMDGSLHHSQNSQVTMKEINRVLKKSGYFIVFREQTLAKWRLGHRNIKMNIKEKYGEFENIYSKDEYIKIIENETCLKAKPIDGPMFSPRSVIITLVKKYTPLRFFNGLLFADFIYIGEKE
jgi:SAM-dependent methyltransferase